MTGNELRDLRLSRGYSLMDVAKAMGLKAYQSVQGYEAKGDEEIDLRPKYWPVLADLFNCPIDDFMPKSKGNVSVSASDNGVAQYAGRDAKVVQEVAGVDKLTPRESYGISLKRRFDPSETLWEGYIKRLMEIKKVHDSM